MAVVRDQCEAVDTLIAPDVIDGKIDMLQRYPTIRKMAPQFLSTLVFRGHAVAANLLRALSVVADLYRTGKRTIPDNAPISFAPKGWMPLFCRMARSIAGLTNSAYSAS